MKFNRGMKAILVGVAFGVLITGLGRLASAEEAGSGKLKVLVYGGGVIHDFKGINEAVMETLAPCPLLEVTSITDTLVPAPPAGSGEKPGRPRPQSVLDDMLAKLPQHDVLFFHHTGGKLTEAQEAALCDGIASGKGFVGIHSAADSFKQSARYMEMIGGMFRGHPAYQDFPVTVQDSNHPIVQGLPKEFVVKDEQYFLKYDPAKIHVVCDAPYQILEYQVTVEKQGDREIRRRVPTGKVLESGRMPAVWTKPWGQGRVVYISLGHDAKAVRQEVVQKLILQGILWAGGRK